MMGAIASVVVIIVAGSIIVRGVSWRTEFPVVRALVSDDGKELTLVVNTCGAEPVLGVLREGSDTIEVSVISTRTFGGTGGDDCQDAVETELRDALRDREMIDTTSGSEIEVIGR